MPKFHHIFIFAAIAALFSSPFAKADPDQGFCPSTPYPVSNGFTQGLQTVTGMNFIAEQFAQSQIKNQLKKIAKGDFDVDIDTYSATDLISGKFKGFDIKGRNVVINGTHISSLEAKSLCDFIYLDYNHNPIVPIAPLYMEIKGTITENDINKTLTSQKFQEEFSKIRVDIGIGELNIAEFHNTKLHIVDDKIYINSDVHLGGMPKFMNIPVRISTGLRAAGNKIRLTDFEVVNGNLGLMGNFLQMLSPTILNLDNFTQNGTNINIKTLNVKDNRIDVEGTVWMPGRSS